MLAMHRLCKEGLFVAMFLLSPLTPVVGLGEKSCKDGRALAIHAKLLIRFMRQKTNTPVEGRGKDFATFFPLYL